MSNSAIFFVLNMAASAALLVWAVRMVRTGVERAYGAELQKFLRRSTKRRIVATFSGAAAAVLMQSSTAVVLLTAGFLGAGSIGAISGLSIILGADLGSAIVVHILSMQLAVVMPFLLLTGVVVFIKSERRLFRQFGRIMVGLALIFVALDMIRASSLPLVGSEIAQTILQYLGSDLISAFLIAALFTWLVHSSVAAILLFATLSSQGVLHVETAFAMVLGANLGAGIVALALTSGMDAIVRRVVWINLILRGGGAFFSLFFISYMLEGMAFLAVDPGAQSLHLHLLFNVLIVLFAIPFASYVIRIAEQFIPDRTSPEDSGSVLDPTLQDEPERALLCVTRELLHLGTMVERNLRRAYSLFDVFEDDVVRRTRDEAQKISDMTYDVRIFLSNVRDRSPEREGSERTSSRLLDLSTISANLEHANDIVVRKLVASAKLMHRDKIQFSSKGRLDIDDLYFVVLRNLQLGVAVLMSDNIEEARELVRQKDKVRDLEKILERRHLERLREGDGHTLETTAIHMDILRSLKLLNSAFASIAYPILEQEGVLMGSRLADED